MSEFEQDPEHYYSLHELATITEIENKACVKVYPQTWSNITFRAAGDKCKNYL